MLPLHTRWRILVGIPLLLAIAGVASFILVRELTADDSKVEADLGPFWYVSALDEDAQKPRITQQTINGILIGLDSSLAPGADACADDPDGASPVALSEVDSRAAGTPVEISPNYLPEGVSVESSEAAECNGVVINVVKWYTVKTRESGVATPTIPSWAGGQFFISRTLTKQRQAPMQGAAERLSAITVSGHPAVLLMPVMPLGYDIGVAETQIVIADGDTMTVVQGRGMPLAEFIAVAESVYAK